MNMKKYELFLTNELESFMADLDRKIEDIMSDQFEIECELNKRKSAYALEGALFSATEAWEIGDFS